MLILSKEENMSRFFIRGFVLGSSFGIFGFMLGVVGTMPRAIILGTISGLLAGLTLFIIDKSRK